MIRIDGHMVRPDAALTYPHFSLRRDRLYRVSRDTQTEEITTQLVVPKSRREIVFQAAHYNPMAGHMGCEKTLNRVMARFYWPAFGQTYAAGVRLVPNANWLTSRPSRERRCGPYL